MDLLKLLQSKNRCLKKFLKASQEFLKEAEAGNLTRLQEFQERREDILKTLSFYDKKISSLILELSTEEKTPALILDVRANLHEKDTYVQVIQETDQKIIRCIEEEKNSLLTELSASDKASRIVKKFRSKWITESGEKLDGKL